MKRAKVLLSLVASIMILINANFLFADKLIKEVDFNVGTDIYSKYIWRGQNLTDNWVAQPTAGASFKEFTVSFWGSYDTDSTEWTERDFLLDYTTGLGLINEFLDKIGLSLGYTYYTFPNLDIDNESHELYVGLGFDVLLSPSFTVYYDWDTGNGTYYEAGISHTFSFEYFDLSPTAAIGYNDSQWGYDSSFSNTLLSLNLSKQICDYFTASATIAESVALDDQYNSEFYGGINLSVDF